MSNSPDRRVPPAEQLRRIRCLLTDVDGVLTDGRIHLNEAGEESKIFHVPSGRSYDRTKAERCYSSPEAAEADGFRQAKR